MRIELIFQKSRSKDFGNVLKNCRIFDLFTEGKEFKLEIVSFEELFQKWDEFNIIYHTTKRWTGTVFIYNVKQDKTNQTFYKLQEVKDCYKQYREVNSRQLFCDHADWGCHKLNSVFRYIDRSYGPFWFDYGYFSDESTWTIDKDRIREILTREAREKRLFSCPIFSDSMFDGILVRLPDTIHIDGEKWVKKYRIRETENGPVKIAYGIDHVMTDYNDDDIPEFSNNYQPVIPKGLSDDELANWYIEMYQKGML